MMCFSANYTPSSEETPSEIRYSKNIIPCASNTYDLGSPSMPFRHGYFGDGTLYLASTAISVVDNQVVVKTGTNSPVFIANNEIVYSAGGVPLPLTVNAFNTEGGSLSAADSWTLKTIPSVYDSSIIAASPSTGTVSSTKCFMYGGAGGGVFNSIVFGYGGAITGGTFNHPVFAYGVSLIGGTFNSTVHLMYREGAGSGAGGGGIPVIFNKLVRSETVMSDGVVCNGIVENYGSITGGSYSNTVYNYGGITGGTFVDIVNFSMVAIDTNDVSVSGTLKEISQ